ncbi:hypothetical protein HO133_005305 [Letharia lupina]|uniref:Cytochrome P450 n=1 Tax=Letharia lupina TaxID=560253 RepID=A0A8H6C880_9LECA|nr:uncharacterized protein HO133_005305 [Letharia lupina]KAF6218762.1 hypothetical protein HO133_005305 [Letharia lupina]
MDLSLFSTFVGVSLLVVVVYVSLVYLFSPTYDPREPPVISSLIPYVGHILGLLRYGQRYFEILSARNNLPIYTLQTLNKRTYVVNSADLVTAVERNEKTIAFFPFVYSLAPRFFDLAPDSRTMDLIRPRFTIASTESIYGKRNPIRLDPELVEAFWDFEKDFTMILLGLYPKYTARKGYAGRRKLHHGLNGYFNRGDHEYGLGVLKARHDAVTNNGGTTDDVARFEIGDLIGVLVNATPTFFWMLLTIYSDAALLEEIRTEIGATMTTTTTTTEPSATGNRKRKHEIDITVLETQCPLLLSAYRELLRHRTQSSSSRSVIRDTILASQYLLKKDSVLLVPGALIHADPIWGPDRTEYNPRRFLKPPPPPSSPSAAAPQSSGAAKVVHPGAYRAWGGGQTLCPGRFFATTEITGAVAMVLMRFEMEAAGGKWVFPKVEGNRVASSIHPPSTDVRVRIRERVGYEGDGWGFIFAEGV